MRKCDAEWLNQRNSFGADGARFSSSAADFKSIPGIVTQQAFGHLTSSGVAGAEDEHAFFIGHDLSFPLVKDGAAPHPPPRQVTPASAIETEALRRERQRIGPR